jgi:hypothetical protein
MPEYPLGPLENRIARQRAALDRAEEERPAIAERAAQIRQQQDAIPAARSAAQALADPQMQQWAEIIHQIEESGATPRAESELSPQLQSNRLTANAGLHYDARSLRRRAAERLADHGRQEPGGPPQAPRPPAGPPEEGGRGRGRDGRAPSGAGRRPRRQRRPVHPRGGGGDPGPRSGDHAPGRCAGRRAADDSRQPVARRDDQFGHPGARSRGA